MTYKIRFSQLASDDLTEVLGWYKEQNIEGLHKRFIEALSKVLKRLENNPQSNPIVHNNVRQALLKKFPYKVLYTFDNAVVEVLIIAVIHQKRDPKIWQGRT
ncbi:MAG: type II toxin-antitoxin system RelE/ParE family toxin [Saprospiraceae bacterium]|nr:type II toxin-antitoxin system RelE/ParE family toxin [Saprospiraceae bacterium]